MLHEQSYIASYAAQSWVAPSGILAFAEQVNCLKALRNKRGGLTINRNSYVYKYLPESDPKLSRK